MSPCVTVESGALSVEAIDHFFRQTPEADHVVLLRQRRPVGLIPRVYFSSKTAGPFGYPVFQRKAGDVLAKRNPLAVEEKTRVTTLYKLAMGRSAEDLYDPVLVVDADGALVGTVTIRQLIQRSTELEIQWATGANPLTGSGEGFFLSRDRRHQTVEVPLVTLSLAVVDSRSLSLQPDLDPARLARLAAALKTRAKALTERERRSAFLFDGSGPAEGW